MLYRFFTFVVFGSVITILASAAELGDDCGVYGWEIPVPPPDSTLLQTHVLARHGDRVPWEGQSCWPNDPSMWMCTLDNAEIPMYSDTQYGKFLPRVYRKVYKFGESLPGNCSVGQLTTIGFNQHIQNGASLRKAYVDTGFLPANFDGDEIYLRSDDEPRTLMSAEALILGMFPPNGSQTEVLRINTLDQSIDYISPNPMLCPKLGEYQKEFFDSPVWLSHYKAVTYPLLTAVSNAINFTVDQDSFEHFSDCLRTHKCHELPWPPGMTSDLYDACWTELAWQYYSQYQYPSPKDISVVGIGFLLKEFWKQINSSVQGLPVEKFLLYLGHDDTLIALTDALLVADGLWPPYASMIILELYEVPSSASGFAIRVIYNGNVLNLPYCSNQALCDYDEFSNYIATVVPTDVAKQCASNKRWTSV
ncbi:hypothetical protein EMCRGX_G029211 [Ephydatia muelleri]|eukprot:Em0013g595a